MNVFSGKKTSTLPILIIIKKKNFIFYAIIFLIFCLVIPYFLYKDDVTLDLNDENLIYVEVSELDDEENVDNTNSDNLIKWLDFEIPSEVMGQALEYDMKSHSTDNPVDWIELISYCAAKNWGEIPKGKKSEYIDDVMKKIQEGQSFSDITGKLKNYSYFHERYRAVLGGLVGYYEVEEEDENNPGNIIKVKKYGLKAFSPIAKGFFFSHYDDFGVSRSYGYKRKHLGNDLMGSVGTPIVAIESGYIEAIGWNQYGGWRIGIRSFDKKRYYYYAHLRKDHPFNKSLKEGSIVQAGDVIGYLGMTGYSSKENVNNITTPHLHFGLQIIFDESQKEGYNEIWVDVYDLINFLQKNKMPVYKDPDTKEYNRTLKITDIQEE